MNKLLRISIYLICTYVSFSAGWILNDYYYNDDNLFEVNQHKTELLKNYTEYYNNTEVLLDSIASWNNDFMDTVVETDVYYEYIISKENLNK